MEIATLSRKVKATDLPLEKLAGNSQVSQEDKVAEVGRQFEAILLRNILAQAHKSVFSSSQKKESTSDGIYQDMLTNNLAEQISRTGSLGLAASWKEQLGHELAETTPHPKMEAVSL